MRNRQKSPKQLHKRPENKDLKWQSYQRRKVKKPESTVLPIDTLSSSTVIRRIDFNNPMHVLIFLLLLITAAKAAKPHASAASPKTSHAPAKINDDSSAPVVSTNPAIRHCAEKLDIFGSQVVLGCTPETEKRLRKKPHLYKSIFESTQENINRLKEIPSANCRLSYLFSDASKCKIKLSTVNEMRNAQGIYSPSEHEIRFNFKMKNARQQVGVYLHESSHAFDLEIQKKANSLIYNAVSPYHNHETKVVFDKIIKSGIENLNKYYHLITTFLEISEKEIRKLQALELAAAKYSPYIKELVTSYETNENIKVGSVIKSSIETKNGISHVHEKIIGVEKFSEKEVLFISSFVSSNLAHQALIDGLHIISRVNRLYKEKQYPTEINAHLHQIYDQTPELFEMLFPGLLRYHMERGIKEYNKCIEKMTSTSHLSLFSIYNKKKKRNPIKLPSQKKNYN